MAIRRVLGAVVLGGALVAAGGVVLGASGEDSSARRLYVDGGSLGGPCSDETPASEVSEQRPWCSLEPLAAAPSGSTVIVRQADYPMLSIPDRDKPLTIRAQAGERPVLEGLEVRGSSGVRIEGFRIRGLARIEEARRVALVRNEISPHGVIVGEAEDVRFEANDIHDLTIELRPAGSSEARCHTDGPGAGVAPWCGYGFRINHSARIEIVRNRLTAIPADGVQLADTEDILIAGNRFLRISAFLDPSEHSDAIQLVGRNIRPVIRRNVFDLTRGIIAHPTPLVGFPGTTEGLEIENNLFVRIRDWAATLLDVPDLRFANNTVWSASEGVVLREHPEFPQATERVRFYNNIVEALVAEPGMFAFEDFNLIGSGPRLGRHDIGGPPRFRNPARSNYRLRRRSPAIDAGTRRGSPKLDLAGARRPKGRGVDLGAYELRR